MNTKIYKKTVSIISLLLIVLPFLLCLCNVVYTNLSVDQTFNASLFDVGSVTCDSQGVCDAPSGSFSALWLSYTNYNDNELCVGATRLLDYICAPSLPLCFVVYTLVMFAVCEIAELIINVIFAVVRLVNRWIGGDRL